MAASTIETSRDFRRVGYTRNEVAFLLSLDHQEALEYAAGLRDSIGRLGSDESHDTNAVDDGDAPFIARWSEVNMAAARIRVNKENIALTQLRLQGYTDEEVASRLGLGRRTVGRRWRATLLEILVALGGEAEEEVPIDHVDRCLQCGQNPRGRTTRRSRVWTSNGWRWKIIERPSSMCGECLREAAGSCVTTKDAHAA
jgi:hypothetical protein